MITISRITTENSHLLDEAFFEAFPYAARIDPAARAKAITNDERTYLYLAYREGLLAGYALAYRFPALFSKGDLAYLYDIEVLPEHRQQGIGKALITQVKQHLAADGALEIWLGTDTDNLPAQALYQTTGAERSEEAFYDFTYPLNDEDDL